MPKRVGLRGTRKPSGGCGGKHLSLDSAVLENTTLEVLGFTGQTITVRYRTIPGNNPQANHNQLWVFEGTVIDWANPSRGVSVPVDSESSAGTFTITGIEISRKDYIVGYSVTPSVNGVSASVLVQVQTMRLAPMDVIIAIESITTDQLIVSYATLRGYRPQSAGNWLGFWRGDVLPWNAQPPSQVAFPEDDVNEGWATFKGPFRAKSTYTVIYFMAGADAPVSNPSAAALLRFDIG